MSLTDVLIATSKKVARDKSIHGCFDCHKSNGGTGMGLWTDGLIATSKKMALGWVYGQVF